VSSLDDEVVDDLRSVIDDDGVGIIPLLDADLEAGGGDIAQPHQGRGGIVVAERFGDDDGIDERRLREGDELPVLVDGHLPHFYKEGGEGIDSGKRKTVAVIEDGDTTAF
jgi:hypothetical protein